MKDLFDMLIKIDRQQGIHSAKLENIEKKLSEHSAELGFAKKQIFRAQGAVSLLAAAAGAVFGFMFK